MPADARVLMSTDERFRLNGKLLTSKTCFGADFSIWRQGIYCAGIVVLCNASTILPYEKVGMVIHSITTRKIPLTLEDKNPAFLLTYRLSYISYSSLKKPFSHGNHRSAANLGN